MRRVIVLVAQSRLYDRMQIVGTFTDVDQMRSAAREWRDQAGIASLDALVAQSWEETTLISSVHLEEH